MLNIKKINYGNILLFCIIFLGVFFRLKGLLTNASLWHDECALAWSLKSKNILELFGPLEFMQMAPPFFLIITKILTIFFGFSETVLRLPSFIMGCSSIGMFYLLAKNILNKKISVLIALLLFSVNLNLINYSFEFKQYAFDVFFTICILLFFIKVNFEDLSLKKTFFNGCLIALIPWFSFVSVFVIAGGFLNILFKKSNLYKKFYLIIPAMLSMLIYLKVYLLANPVKGQMVEWWKDYFINLDFKHFLWLSFNNLNYFFAPAKFILFILFLIIVGIMILYKEKSDFLKISFNAFILLVIASLLHIYPFAERLILFLFPIFLLLVIKPVDYISYAHKLKSLVIIVLILFSFYSSIIQIPVFFNSYGFNKGEAPSEMMKIMSEKIKPSDIIFVSNASDAEYVYYSSFYGFKNKVVQERIKNVCEREYLRYLNTLPSGDYWFYLPIDYIDNPVLPWIKSWIGGKIIYFNQQIIPGILLYIHIA